MSTKVNRTYWDGTIYYQNNWPNANDCGYLDGYLSQLISNNKWNIAENDEFDLSVCPWGLPLCSWSSLATPVFAKDADDAAIVSFQYSNRGNMPIFFNRYNGRVTTDTYSSSWARISNKKRVVGDTAKATDSSYIRYTTTVDSQNTSPSELSSGTMPIVSLNYQSVRLVSSNIIYYDNTKTEFNTDLVYSATDLNTFRDLKSSDPTGSKYKLVKANCFLCAANNSNLKIYAKCAGKTNIPEYLQTQYYNAGTTEYIDISRDIFSALGQSQQFGAGYGVYGNSYPTIQGISAYGNFCPTLKTVKSADYGCDSYSTSINNASPIRQRFDDVSYHWEQHLYYYKDNKRRELRTGQSIPFVNNNSMRLYIVVTLEIDSSIYDNYYDAAYAAILHEYAFSGLPFVLSTNDLNKSIGNSAVYVPEFDLEHMMTTGRYKQGSDALTLVNALWNDIFDSSIPTYDPSYVPPEPEPIDTGDTGNRNNSAYRGIYATGSNRFYALNQSELSQFITFVNNMYVNDPDPDAAEQKMKIDYKGSNPNDYIVGIYAVPIPLEYVSTTENITLGPVETNVPCNRMSVQAQGAFSWGYYDIPIEFGDFRDYEPYTQIELYIPLCGTVKLDPAEYVGHRVIVDAIWDIQTGELTARVLRDGETITHTLQGSIAIQVPICSRDMGTFQNNQHQLRMGLIQAGLNSLSTTKRQAESDINTAARAISSGGSQSTSIGNITSGINPFNLAQNAASTALDTYDLVYKLQHMQPQVYISGSASSANAINMERQAFIFIKRCRMLANYNPQEYSHVVGNACCITGSINSFSGFTMAATANLDDIITKNNSLPATEQEKQLLKKTLQAGFYI